MSVTRRTMRTCSISLVLALVLAVCKGAEDGLARTPPMGWRSWNAFGGNVNSALLREVADALAVKRDPSTGDPVEHDDETDSGALSLADLGYDELGLDDGFQACSKGVGGSFHSKNGTLLLNSKKFPNMRQLVDHIHAKHLRAGFYLNNCICKEGNPHLWSGDVHYERDVEATLQWGFDAVKLDHCGAFNDLNRWYSLFHSMGSNRIIIEACHKLRHTSDFPRLDYCPFHVFRTSEDIFPAWESVYINLQSVRQFQGDVPLSRPGCWAYPDMLEVGKLANTEEDRAHFGAWVVTSSPLILGYDVRKSSINRRVWPIISNRRAIAINQDWAGHPGRLVHEVVGSSRRFVQVWMKPLSGQATAVFILNDNEPSSEDTVVVPVADLDPQGHRPNSAFDVWTGNDVTAKFFNPRKSNLSFTVKGHASILIELRSSISQQVL